MKKTRRALLKGTAGLTLASYFQIPLVRPAVASNADLMFFADMETSKFSDYENSEFRRITASGNAPEISGDVARAGSKSLRMYLNRKTSRTSYRTEATTQHDSLEFFKTVWIGFSIYLPSSWGVSDTWGVLFQIHDTPKDWNISFNPIFAIREKEKTSEWYIQQRYVTESEDTHSKSDQKTAIDGLYGQMELGKWTDWIVEYRPDYRLTENGGNGVTRVWRNGNRIIDYRGPNAYNQARAPYLKFGLYKSGWKNRSINDRVDERLCYFDQFRVSKPGMGSYELVDPNQSGSRTIRPNPPDELKVQ